MDALQRKQDILDEFKRLQAAGIGEYCYVMSLDNRPTNTTKGRVVQVTAMQCATHIVDQSHRVATETEIVDFAVRCETERHRIEAAEVRKLPSSFRVNLRSK